MDSSLWKRLLVKCDTNVGQSSKGLYLTVECNVYVSKYFIMKLIIKKYRPLLRNANYRMSINVVNLTFDVDLRKKNDEFALKI